MIERLARFFVKSTDGEEKRRHVIGTLCGGIGIVANLLLCTFKMLAGVISGSVAVMADGLNNLSDAASSLVTLLGFRLAAKKPDKHHPFGHGRIEYLTGLCVAAMVALMGVDMARDSLDRLLHPTRIEGGLIPILVLAAAIPVKLLLYRMNRRIGRKIESEALGATATDCLTDAAASTVTMLCLLLGRLTALPLDGICGIALALLILYSALQVAKSTLDPLLGQPPKASFVKRIADITAEYPEILGIHDLIVHDYGPGRRMISLHAEVRSDSDLIAAHDAIDNLENRLMEQLGCHAVIHMDPLAVDDRVLMQTSERLKQLAREVDPSLSVHDVRLVQGPTHVNLIFDLLLRSDQLTEAQAEADVRTAIARAMPGYRAVMHVERSYLYDGIKDGESK